MSASDLGSGLRETHQAFHRDFARRMRGRANAVIDALYAPDRSGLEQLRDNFGVSYLVVSTRDYGQTAPNTLPRTTSVWPTPAGHWEARPPTLNVKSIGRQCSGTATGYCWIWGFSLSR